MFRVICATVILSMAMSAEAQTWKDFGRALKQEVQRQVEEKKSEVINSVENECAGREGSAQVQYPDRARTGTWIVRSSDGRTFQVSQLSISGAVQGSNTSLPDLLSMTSSASFSRRSSGNDLIVRYGIQFSYRNLGEGSDNALASMLLNAAGSTMQKRLPSSVEANLLAVEGQSLSGDAWCLGIRSSGVSSIELITQ